VIISCKQLESYPLAEQYGWCAPKKDTGGILYIFPPTVTRAKTGNGRCGKNTLQRERVNSIHPHDLIPSALEAAELLHSRIPFVVDKVECEDGEHQ